MTANIEFILRDSAALEDAPGCVIRYQEAPQLYDTLLQQGNEYLEYVTRLRECGDLSGRQIDSVIDMSVATLVTLASKLQTHGHIEVGDQLYGLVSAQIPAEERIFAKPQLIATAYADAIDFLQHALHPYKARSYEYASFLHEIFDIEAANND